MDFLPHCCFDWFKAHCTLLYHEIHSFSTKHYTCFNIKQHPCRRLCMIMSLSFSTVRPVTATIERTIVFFKVYIVLEQYFFRRSPLETLTFQGDYYLTSLRPAPSPFPPSPPPGHRQESPYPFDPCSTGYLTS